CPMCAWRRSLKVYGQVSKIIDSVPSGHEYIFLTLTIKNCSGEDLCKTLDELFKAYKRFTELKDIEDCFVGWFRSLEVTYNKSRNDFHPHIHVILCTKTSYFKKHYIKKDDFMNMWRQCMRLDYDPVVHVEKFKGMKNAIAETSKYTVKDSDYLFESETLTDIQVKVLDSALANRRLIAYGGLFRKIHKELNLGDAYDGDLVFVDGEEVNKGEYIIEKYGWHVGLKNYYILKDK
ncbi:MAG: protein rep, partial [Turicibacter sp.]